MTELFVVATEPAPLAGMPFPDPPPDWAALHAAGYRRVLRLHRGDYDPSPLLVHELVLEDLFGGRMPTDPDVERARVHEAARLAAEWVQRGDGVIVHCLGGTGRTGTVLACTLCRLGRDTESAIHAVKQHRPRWPESDWQAQAVLSED